MPIYYVGPAGNNGNPGTFGSPWLTASYAAAHVAPGDTIRFLSGTYTGSTNVIDSERFSVISGTSSDPITITTAPGEPTLAVLQPPNNLHAIRLTAGAPAYLILQDLVSDLVNSTAGGVEPEGVYLSSGAHHNRFIGVEVKNAKAFGVVISANNGAAHHNDFITCNIHATGNGSGDRRNGHGVYVTSSDNLFDGCEVHANEGYGYHVYENSGTHANPSRNIIRKGRVYGNGTHGGTAFGVLIGWGDANQVHNMLIYGNPGGMQLYSLASNTLMYYNTLYGNADYGLALQYYGAGNVVANTISYGNGQNFVDYGGSGTVTLTTNLFGTNPLFTDAPSADFTLQAASPAINTATTAGHVTDDYAGGARGSGAGGPRTDIGAYEYGATPALDAPPARPPDPHDPSAPCCQTKPQAPGTPSVGPIVTKTGGGLPRAVNPSAWEQFCDGDGAVPSAADATDAESWIS